MINSPIYISVVLSTYNEEKYIATAIKSILEQTYPYFEFIIINDGSTDRTLEVIETFKDDRIVIINKENTGLADSLNRGIGKAKYEWIARMDGDDIAYPDRFEKQISYLKTHNDIDVLGGQFYSINETGNKISESISQKPTNSFQCNMYIKLGWAPLAHPTALIKKSILTKVRGYDPNFKCSQDLDLWSRISQYGRITNIKEPVLLYRKHINNISNKNRGSQMRLAFMGFVKYAICYDGILKQDEFKRLYESVEEINEINCKQLTKVLESKGLRKLMYATSYYSWKLLQLLNIRINKQKYQKIINQ